jgi:hypothetical protein
MTHAQRRTTLEKNLSFVLGRPICLHAPETLSLTPNELKRSYYRRAHEFHPDKAASLGVAPEYLEERFKALQEAYSLSQESLESGEIALLARAGSGFPGATRAQGAPKARAAAKTRAATPTTAKATRPRESGYYTGKIPTFQLRTAQYLYYTGRISWDTLIRSLTWQYGARPKIGELAMSLGYLTPESVLSILKSRWGTEFFGDTAIRLGLLDLGQRAILVGRQRLLNLPIGEYFVRHGHLDEESLAETLSALFRHNFRSRVAESRFASGQ